MRKTLIAVALAASFASPVFAEEGLLGVEGLTANVGAVSDYVFRGITQTAGKPALQAGIDYAHSSGLYVGAWGSNVQWVSDGGYTKGNRFETDLYGGYKFETAGVGVDVGVIRYVYPYSEMSPTTTLHSPNTTEAYVGFTYGIAMLKYNHTISDDFIGWTPSDATKNSKGSNYTDLTVTYPVDETLNVVAHVGRQIVKNVYAASYTDWKLGVTKDVGFGVVGLAVTGSDANQSATDGVYNGTFGGWNGHDMAGTRVALSFLKTF